MFEAAEIIAERGSEAMKMSALSERCGISIGSLYQHFPDKTAVLAAVAEKYHEQTRECIDAQLAGVDSWDAFSTQFAGLIEAYHQMFIEEPVIRDVWSGVAADKALQEMELQSARDNGVHLASHIRRVMPFSDPHEVERAAFFVMALGESVMRLAVLCPPEEGREHVVRYTQLAINELTRAATATKSPAARAS